MKPLPKLATWDGEENLQPWEGKVPKPHYCLKCGVLLKLCPLHNAAERMLEKLKWFDLLMKEGLLPKNGRVRDAILATRVLIREIEGEEKT